jgi:L-ascorbate metabolism protein UlaG (beta-lactamase superfamily)
MLRLADRLGRSRGRLAVIDCLAPPPPPPPLRPDVEVFLRARLSAIWIGHATVLLRIAGMTVLTDPVMAHRVGLGIGLATVGPRRRVAAALNVQQLPPIDLILLSHAHFDHLDRPTLNRLPRRTPIVTADHTADLVRDLGYRQVTELRWGESADVGPLRVSACPVAHWGARTFHDDHRGYNAYLIEAKTGPADRLLFGGDSAYHERWRGLPAIDLAVVGIGAYNPYIRGHADPEQAWAMANHVRAAAVLPMHWGTFRLSYEPWEEPIERFLAVADPSRVALRQIGGMWTRD